MAPTTNFPFLPQDDAIVSVLDGDIAPQPHAPDLRELPWPSAVWLGPDACMMQNHVQPTEARHTVVQVVGVADCGDWTGAVLMLG